MVTDAGVILVGAIYAGVAVLATILLPLPFLVADQRGGRAGATVRDRPRRLVWHRGQHSGRRWVPQRTRPDPPHRGGSARAAGCRSGRCVSSAAGSPSPHGPGAAADAGRHADVPGPWGRL